jgi:hypothetical protein
MARRSRDLGTVPGGSGAVRWHLFFFLRFTLSSNDCFGGM